MIWLLLLLVPFAYVLVGAGVVRIISLIDPTPTNDTGFLVVAWPGALILSALYGICIACQHLFGWFWRWALRLAGG